MQFLNRIILQNLKKNILIKFNFVFNKIPLNIAGVKQFKDIVDLLMPFKKKAPESVIVKDYRPDLIWTAFQNEVDSIKSENERLRRENEKLKSKQTFSESDTKTETQSSTNSEVEKLKSYLQALKKPKLEFSFFDFDEYKHENTRNNGKIGNGAQSNVYKVYKDERTFYAKKEFNDQSFSHKELERFLQESEILFYLRHPCIVRVYGFNYGNEEHPPAMILSFEKSSLEDSIKDKSLTDEQKCQITVEIVLGMRYIHGKNFIHRDLKPSNILLSKNDHVRISDFGLAKNDSLQESMTKGIGTLMFMAPELLQDGDGDVKYDRSVDVYSFGKILYFIVLGDYPPFNLLKTARGEVIKIPNSVPSWVSELITKCLSFNHEERPSFHDVFETMKANNYDLFSDVGGRLSQKKKTALKNIEARIAKIEAFEYQYKDD